MTATTGWPLRGQNDPGDVLPPAFHAHGGRSGLLLVSRLHFSWRGARGALAGSTIEGMGAEGQTEPHWEVLGESRRLDGIVAYRPPAHDSSDAVTLHGEAKVVGSRDWTRLATGIYGAVCTAGFCWAAFTEIEWLVGAIIIPLGCLASILMHKPQKRLSWRPPSVAVDSEGITAKTVDGLTYSGTWPDLKNLRVRSIEWEHGTVVRMSWTRPSEARIVADLGDTIDVHDLRQAISSRAPMTMTLHLSACDPSTNE